MGFTLWNLFEATILTLNAVCILNEERFLAKIGWSAKSPSVQGFGEQPTVKSQILNLIHAIRTVARSIVLLVGFMPTNFSLISFNVPLIFLNIVTIIFKLILG